MRRTLQPSPPEVPFEQRLVLAKQAEQVIRASIDFEADTDRSNLAICIRSMKDLLAHEREYRKQQCQQSRTPIRLKPTLAMGPGKSAGIYYASAHSLEYRSHRFILLPDETIQYHREAFNVDSQCLGSRPLNLLNLVEITNVPDALSELQYVESELKDVHPANWSTKAIRIPIRDC